MTDLSKPKRGRPAAVEREQKHEPKPSLKMRAKPNWEGIDVTEADTPDKLHIPHHMVPQGMSLQWVTDTVLGQPFSQHRAGFEKKGWTPVHQQDFDGQLDGMFMPKGVDGEIRMTGMTLMARPKELTDRAKKKDRREALEQVAIKEQSLRGGDLQTTLDSQHPSAINSNRINKSIERIQIPED